MIMRNTGKLLAMSVLHEKSFDDQASGNDEIAK